jgi:reductive dehalogenase
MIRRIWKDETSEMDLAVGVWKKFAFAPPPETERPTYEIVGPTEKYDERDHVFSRTAMREGTPLFEEYYRRHPEKKEVDEENRKRSKKIAGIMMEKDPVNENLSASTFLRAWIMSRPEYIYQKGRVRVLPLHSLDLQKVHPDAKQMTRKIKALGLHLGAGKVRIARLDNRWVFSHKAVPVPKEEADHHPEYPYVICLAVPQNPYFTANHSGLSVNFDVGWHYSYASFISYAIADFIRSLGWSARPSPTISTPYLVTPLFVDAGIGEDGRCGYTVTKEFGNNWRPGSIATDLPLIPDKPVDFGLQDFCGKCALCAETCPAGAISGGGRQIVRGYKKWHIDADKCYTYWTAVGRTCGVCQAVCPWNHEHNLWHKIVREVAQRQPALRKFLIKGEALYYSHRAIPEPRWLAERVDIQPGTESEVEENGHPKK